MPLETLQPDPDRSIDLPAEVLEALAADGLVYHVWGGDWCGDCQAQLPPFAAALEAAGVDDDAIETYPVEKDDDGSKVGPGVDAYGIEYIPTVVVERDGEELARVVETGDPSIAEELAEALSATVETGQ